jgi:arylsulfatase A-like enzyme
LTGKYPATLGLTNFIGGGTKGKVIDAPYIRKLPLTEKSIATALKEGGYKTYHIGKWHLGIKRYWPENHGFDVNIAGCHFGLPEGGYFSPYGNPRLEDGPKGEYLTNRLTNEAINLIKSNGDDPFFLHLAYYAVHIPIQVPREYAKKYREKARELGLNEMKTFEKGGFFPCDQKKRMRIRRRLIQSNPKYAGMIQVVDENIGKLIKALEDSGKLENTVIIFTSDNGGLSTAEGSPTCNAPLGEGKGWMYEGGTREPLIVRWSGVVKDGSLCEIPVTSPDFYPTFLEVAGIDLNPEQHCDGISIIPLLKGEKKLERDAIYWHYPHYGNQGGTPGASVRAGDHKLIKFFEDNHVELYNLNEDISEENDLSMIETKKRDELLQKLTSWLEKVEARIPKPNPNYKKE